MFGSEAKALFASGEVRPAPDLAGLDEVFTLWGARAPRTAFLGVDQLPPGGLLVWERGRIVEQRRWWAPEYGVGDAPDADLRELLATASGFASARTCRWGPTCPGGSTRA